MYRFYLDDLLLPVTPGVLETQIVNKNKTITLASGEDYSIPEKAGLTEFSFSCLVPEDIHSHLRINDVSQQDILTKLSELKENAKPFVFQVIGKVNGELSLYVTLEEYKIIENAENGKDIIIDISLKKYNTLKTATVKVEEKKMIISNAKAGKGLSKALPKNQNHKTYTVKKGDTLSLIAKRYLGNSNLWKKLYDLNKESINNPNKIFVGQVIKLD